MDTNNVYPIRVHSSPFVVEEILLEKQYFELLRCRLHRFDLPFVLPIGARHERVPVLCYGSAEWLSYYLFRVRIPGYRFCSYSLLLPSLPATSRGNEKR